MCSLCPCSLCAPGCLRRTLWVQRGLIGDRNPWESLIGIQVKCYPCGYLTLMAEQAAAEAAGEDWDSEEHEVEPHIGLVRTAALSSCLARSFPLPTLWCRVWVGIGVWVTECLHRGLRSLLDSLCFGDYAHCLTRCAPHTWPFASKGSPLTFAFRV